MLNHNADQNGHTYLPEDKLLKATDALLGTDSERTKDALDTLVETGVCTKTKYDGKNCIFLKKYSDAEQYICEKLRLLENSSITSDEKNINRAIDMCEYEEGITYAPLQRKAIIKANCFASRIEIRARRADGTRRKAYVRGYVRRSQNDTQTA